LDRLIRAYRLLFQRLEPRIDALLLELQAGEITQGGLVRLERYKDLLDQTADELGRFGALTEAEMMSQADIGIALGGQHGIGMLQATTGIQAGFNQLPNETVRTLLGFLDPDGPLVARVRQLAPQTSQFVIDTLKEAVGLGYNPRKTARLLRDAYGRGLTDALRMTRTVQLYSYREANRATYVANSDVVSGWIWYAKLDSATCMSCVAQHGSQHGLDETLNDHHNGRCAMLPIVPGFDAPVAEGAGQEWFERLTPEQQRQMMGKGKYEAWTQGGTNFSDLSIERIDPVYGTMRTEAPLWALLGAEPPPSPAR
jgi:hypothetical protein